MTVKERLLERVIAAMEQDVKFVIAHQSCWWIEFWSLYTWPRVFLRDLLVRLVLTHN